VHGLVLVALVVVAGVSGVATRVPDLSTDDRGGIRGRLDEWRVAARVVVEHPIVGVGPEGYRIAFGGAVDDRYEQRHGRSPLPDRAHSAPVDIAATLGLPGLALVALVLAGVAPHVLAAARGTAADAAVGAAVVGYAVQALFLFPLAELDPTAWLLAGTLVAVRRHRRHRGSWPAAPAVAAAALAGAVGAVGVVSDRAEDPARAAGLRPDVAAYHLEVALEEEAVGSSASLDRAIAAVEEARSWHPRDPVVVAERTRLLVARAQRTQSRRHVDEARVAVEAAVDDDPRNAALLLRLGVVRVLDGDDAGAEDAWIEAERLAPASAAASADLAVLHLRNGRTDEARAAARRALDRDPQNAVAADVLRQVDGT
jgi:hypothetical protein